jgi:hypothetical protein
MIPFTIDSICIARIWYGQAPTCSGSDFGMEHIAMTTRRDCLTSASITARDEYNQFNTRWEYVVHARGPREI